MTPTGQRLTPVGRQLEFAGRPTAIALRPDGRTAAVLNAKNSMLAVIDLASRKVRQSLAAGSGSFAGIAYNPKGDRLFASDAGAIGRPGRIHPDIQLGPSGARAVTLTTASP